MEAFPANHDIRVKMFKHNIKNFEVAKYIKIAPSTLSIWMNRTLKLEERKKIMMAIEDLKNCKGVSEG